MRKQVTSSVLKGIFTSAILVLVLIMGGANAAEKHSGKKTPFELKYVGKVQEQPVFQLNVDNAQQEDVYLKIADESGIIIYSDRFNEKSFSKNFQFDINQGNSTRIKMTLVSKSLKETQLFEINSVAKLVENVVVTKVD